MGRRAPGFMRGLDFSFPGNAVGTNQVLEEGSGVVTKAVTVSARVEEVGTPSYTFRMY